MRILLVTSIFPPEIGGPATYVDELARRLLPENQVTVVTFGDQKIPKRPFVVLRVKTQGNPLLRQWRLLGTIYRRAQNVDVIYSQGAIVVGLAAMLVGKLLRKKTFIKFVGDEVWETAQQDTDSLVPLHVFYQKNLSENQKVLSWLQRLGLHLATQIITPSRELKRFLVKQLGISAHKISVIPNAVEKQDLEGPKIKNQLIFVGRLVPWKHVEAIIRSVNLARKKKPWHLVIVGDGPDKKRLVHLVEQLQARRWVRFTGALSQGQSRRKISQSQALILYSSYEGLPHVILEAMLAKTAVIASDIPGNREVLEGGALGKLVKPSKPEILAEVLKESFSKEMVQTAHKVAKQKYSWDTHLRLLLSVMQAEKVGA